MKFLKRIHKDWKPFFNDDRINELKNIINQIEKENKTIYPKLNYLFRTLFYFGPDKIKLVILGQDPYIGPNQACGFSFSVPKSQLIIPPSLKNIYKEIKNCYPNFEIPKHGSLRRWVVEENILLLNSALTVIEGQSNSHQELWSDFTDKLIKWISDNTNNAGFLLMGNFAKSKAKLIDKNKHMVFETAHPSPLSATRFFGCAIFKKIDEWLTSINKKPIKWFK